MRLNIKRFTSDKSRNLFVVNIRPMAYCARIFGVFPISNLHQDDASLVSYDVFSIWKIWSLVFMLVLPVIGFVFLYFQQQKKRFELMVLFCLHMLTFTAHQMNCSDNVKLVKSVYNYDCHYSTLQVKSNEADLKLQKYCWAAMLILISLYNTPLDFLIGHEYGTFAEGMNMYFTHNIPNILFSTTLLFYIFLIRQINIRARSLRTSLAGIYDEVVTTKCNPMLVRLHVDKYRNIHGRLASTVKTLNSLVHMKLVVMYMTAFIKIIFGVFWATIGPYGTTTAIVAIHSATRMSLLFFLSTASDEITDLSTSFIKLLLSKPISHLDEGVQQQILHFLEQAHDVKDETTAAGLFVVNKKAVFGFCSIISTYFIFWAQLNAQWEHQLP